MFDADGNPHHIRPRALRAQGSLLALLALRASLRLLLRFDLLTGLGSRGACKSVGAVLTAKLLTASVHGCVKPNHRALGWMHCNTYRAQRFFSGE